MEKVFIVMAEYHAPVSYGVDTQSYICGAYKTKEEATSRESEMLSKITKYKKLTDNAKLGEYDDIYAAAEEELGFNVEPYSFGVFEWEVDVYIEEHEFGDFLVEAGGACYEE